MKVISNPSNSRRSIDKRRRCDGIWLFDGMHRGHHKVFEALDERLYNAKSKRQ